MAVLESGEFSRSKEYGDSRDFLWIVKTSGTFNLCHFNQIPETH